MVIEESKLRKLVKKITKKAEDVDVKAKRIHEGPSPFCDRDYRVIALQNEAHGLKTAAMMILELLHEEHQEKRWPTLAKRK